MFISLDSLMKKNLFQIDFFGNFSVKWKVPTFNLETKIAFPVTIIICLVGVERAGFITVEKTQKKKQVKFF